LAKRDSVFSNKKWPQNRRDNDWLRLTSDDRLTF
jgi:hypothetical protein